MNWRFWKKITITETVELGPCKQTYSVTSTDENQAKRILREMLEGDSS